MEESWDERRIGKCFCCAERQPYNSTTLEARQAFDHVLKNPQLFSKSNLKSRLQPTGFGENDDCPGAVKAKKEGLKAAAMKWFPYGYGSATGTNFVIEEIGYVSDDEEQYGEFQGQRKAEIEKEGWVKERHTHKRGLGGL